MTHTVNTRWVEKMAFESEVGTHKIMLDADDEAGGEDRGPRPKILLLTALGGCTGMDVIYILKKMRVDPSYFNLNVEATVSDDEIKRYAKIHVVYEFKDGDNLDKKKVQNAVELSQNKYCSVSAMLRDGSEVTYEIKYL